MVSKKIEKLVDKFLKNRTYLRNGAKFLADRWGVNPADVYEAKDEARRRLRLENAKKVKRLFFDIETSPNIAYVWRTGYRIRVPHQQIIQERQVICVSYKWWGEDKVHNIYWKDSSDRNVIEEFMPILKSADEIVSYNGDKFDVRFLQGRAAFWNITVPTKYRSFDLYKKVKAQFDLNNYSLAYVTKFLGVRGKMETGGFELWSDLLQTYDKDKSKAAAKKMIEYCNQDIIATEDLYNRVQKYTKPVTNMSVLHGGAKWGCPNCGSQNVDYAKSSTSAMGVTKRHMSCNECESYFDISNKTYMKKLEFKLLNNGNS